MRCLVVLGLWVVASSALAGGPDYDAFSEPDGKMATTRQEIAAWSMLRDPEQLEAVYADAVKGMPRAIHVMQQLEATFAASGREVAERSSRPGCLVPVYKELSGTCRPDWSSLDYLSKDRPGGIRLREVIFGAFAARARERGLENEPILAAVNGLLSLELARGVLLKAEAAATVPRGPGVVPVPGASPGPQAQAPEGGAGHPTLRPGPNAGESIPARSSSQRVPGEAAAPSPTPRSPTQPPQRSSTAAEGAALRPYGGPGGGHHVPARSAVTGAAGYDANEALAIPNAELKRLGISHSAVTGAQMTGYRAFARTGAPLTWEAVSTIEANALVRGGMAPDMARATVTRAIDALKQAGVPGPTRIPWGQ